MISVEKKKIIGPHVILIYRDFNYLTFPNFNQGTFILSNNDIIWMHKLIILLQTNYIFIQEHLNFDFWN